MATFNEISYNILNIARGGISSDDDRLNIRQIKFWVEYYRARLLMEFTDAGKNIDPHLVQDLGCLKLTEVDRAECPSITWESKIKKATIPKVISLPQDRGILFVGYIDKQKPIAFVSADTMYWNQHRFITNEEVRAFLINDQLYIDSPTDEDLCFINVRGVFENPSDVETEDTDGNKVCFDDDTDVYPMPKKLVQMVTERILRVELPALLNGVNDELNTARQEDKPQVAENENRPLS